MSVQFRKYAFNKLVRDTSIDNMEADGAVVESRTLEGSEFAQHLAEKLLEESSELVEAIKLDNTQEAKEEIADLLEIIDALLENQGVSIEEIRMLQHHKREKRGGFGKGLYVGTVSCPEGSFFDGYCAKDPSKYMPVED